MKKKLVNITFVVVISLILFSCSKEENPVRYDSFVIYGKVIGGIFNAGAPGMKVLHNNDVVYTDNYGGFIFGGSSNHPVDNYYVTDNLKKTGSIFKDVSTGDIYLPHSVEDININNLPHASISVTLQSGLGNSNKFKVFFTNDYNINCIGEDGYCNVYLPENRTYYGRVSVLLYTVNNDIVTSYDKFGFKNYVGLQAGSSVDLVFTDSMMNFNPPEVLVSGYVSNIPPHTSTYPSFLMLSMTPRKANYFYPASKICDITGNTFSFLIPADLPVSYYPVVSLNFSDSGSIGIFNSNLNYLLPTNGITNLNIVNPSQAQILNPAPNSYIDSNTEIRLYAFNSNSIYHITVENESRKFHIYTKNDIITLWDIYRLGIGGLTPNTSVTVKVCTIGLYNSVNDFVSSYYNNIPNFTTQEVSQTNIVKPKF